MNVRRTVAVAAIAGVSLLGLAACSDDAQDTPPTNSSAVESTQETPASDQSDEPPAEETDETTEESTEEATDETTEESTEPAEPSTSESSAAPESGADDPSTPADGGTDAGDGAYGPLPSWAKPMTTPGTKIGTIAGDNISVDVYQVAVVPSPKNSMLADAKTNEPLIKEGDDIVWVNYVVTNIGTEPIDLGASLVSIRATYADWPYLSGLAGITDSAQADEQQVVTFSIAPGNDKPYTFEPGQSYSWGENYIYQGAKDLEITVGATPVDADGDLIHDQKQEFEGIVALS